MVNMYNQLVIDRNFLIKEGIYEKPIFTSYLVMKD